MSDGSGLCSGGGGSRGVLGGPGGSWGVPAGPGGSWGVLGSTVSLCVQVSRSTFMME